jgi:hypothetical protein
LFGLAVVAGAAVSANAFEFRCRWVERVGSTDTVIGGDGATFTVTPGSTHNIRLQFGVFDDGTSAAPAGGYVGWNVGTLDVSGAAGNSSNTRSPGRLSPFNFAAQPDANGNPPLPGGDPFTHLTAIDNTLGTQSPIWQGCVDTDGDGIPDTPTPAPAANVRGRNTFVSTYAITTATNAGTTNYSITAGGNLIAASEWRTVGTPTPPDCDTGDPGAITYAPFPTDPVAFTCTLNIVVPAPGALALMGLGGLIAARRRR